ncbi:hypothetical protein LLEC1_02453 [Akanthomyces lecanii]|uniref:C2H2-type domain-containing protein n=1 Tax=Cordyceps confragosa TaxID=2714763 RepID=A0A179I9E5_CORDF|nr:hypothetical protein LLEC1_02453 [Akanthomyces lecanii]
MDSDDAASLPLRLRSTSPAPAVQNLALDHAVEESTTVEGDKAEDISTAKKNDETKSAAKHYSVEDYFGVQYDDSGQLHIVYTCPRPDTQCDGFSFSSIQECIDHESDWHDAPYKCFVCGQTFASGTRLRRHEHYKDSKIRADEVEATETRKSGCRVYHGNDPARRRARTLARLLKKEEAELEVKRGKEVKKRAREMVASVKKELARKRRKDGPLVVIGAEDGVAVTDEDGRDGINGCEEPCCPYYEKDFINKAAYSRHVASQGHLHAAQMGAALVQRLTMMAVARTSKQEASATPDVEMPDYSRSGLRAGTPPPARPIDTQTQLLSPPPTPHGTQHDTQGGDDDNEGDWDDLERTPMELEARLAKTQRTLRELRCNAPGCPMYERRMASSQGYWGHLASEAHAAAMKAWSDRGGDAVYVGV